ncbi:MAG: competence/damage-inducible protein A [Chloroflexota bacterium]
MYRVAILTIGDEICIGQIINTNAAWLASRITDLGAEVVAHSSVRDDIVVINKELARLESLADAILITGGLGPTHDDVTKIALAEYFGCKLVMHEPTLAVIIKRYTNRGVQLTERNQSQAIIPENAIALTNPKGAAPGMLFRKDNKIYVSMPGVPAEMKAITEDHVLDVLKQAILNSKESVKSYLTLQTAGIPESMLADLIGEPDSFPGKTNLAFLPSYGGVRLRLGAEGADFIQAQSALENFKKFIYSRAGKFIYAEGSEAALAETTGALLKRNRFMLAVAESCTGGLLGAEFTNASGSSEYFAGGVISYSNELKIKLLGVSPKTLEIHGAVSEETAIEMAIGAKKNSGATHALSVTGIAGPGGGSEEKPVGTVWIGLAHPAGAFAKLYNFSSDRDYNRKRSVASAILMLYNLLITK